MTNTILLADDSVTIQKVIELTFMDQDYEVVSVSDGDEALERLGGISPDVVIADVHMPGASGYEVARRSKELHPGTPVLVLVGTFEPFDAADVDAAGADGFLKKPFDSQELLQRVGELLAAREDGAGAADLEPAPEPAADPGEQTGTLTGVQPPSQLESEAAGWSLPSTPLASGGSSSGVAVNPWDDAAEPTPERSAWDGDTEQAEAWDAATGSSDDQDEPTVDETADRDRPWVAAAPGLSAEPATGSSEDPEPTDGGSTGNGDGVSSQETGGDETTWVSDWQTPATGDREAVRAGGSGGGEPFPDLSRSPFAGSPTSAAAEPAPSASPPVTASSGLSDDDVDRVARRVVELLSDQAVREVAWEVVPDLAEVVIKDRLRELESQLD